MCLGYSVPGTQFRWDTTLARSLIRIPNTLLTGHLHVDN